jgi:hypothetical protein
MAAAASRAFIYGRPVQPSEFLDRKADLRTVYNRLRHSESTAVVGEPHVGKSSLLLKLADEETKQAHLGDKAARAITCLLDLHPIDTDFAPEAFWQEAIDPLRAIAAQVPISQELRDAADAGYTRRRLERLFNALGRAGWSLFLLLDEFEHLLVHPSFQHPAFFALLRSLATRTGGLAIVTTSRMSVVEMNECGRGLLEAGSPFFNNMIEMRLRPFDEVTVGRLLEQAGDAFSQDDRRFVRRVAGRHPFLLQAMAAALLETRGSDRQAMSAERFFERIAFHFDDLWRTLDDRTRTTAVILSLMELGGQALGQSFAYGEIENVDAFGPELRKLADRGLAERVGKGWKFDWQHGLLWRGEQWTTGAQAFTWWVRDVIIAEARRVAGYEEWLANKRYRFLLTKQQWDGLVEAVRSAPGWAARGVGALAQSLFAQLLGKK